MKWAAAFAAIAALLWVRPGPAQVAAAHTAVVVDSNPALFAVMAALDAAGDNAAGAQPLPLQIQRRIAAGLQQHPAPVQADLKAYCATHHQADANRELAQYVTLALFLSSPPGLGLAVPAAGLPPDAAAVQDFAPLVARFWSEANLDAVWNAVQPDYQTGLDRDAALVRRTVTAVDAFFRIPQAYSPRQLYIFPDALVPAGHADALNYQDNYYFVASLDLAPEIQQVRHTYLHFLLDPLIAQYPAAIMPVEQEILPLVARAPALDLQFKRDPELLYTECLVRAVEIQLDSAGPAQQQAELDAAMGQGLVLTQMWFDQLTAFRADPASFREFYPTAAFALRIDELSGQVKHLKFAPAPPPSAVAVVQPVRAPSLLEQAQKRFDGHDYTGASELANAALRQVPPDRAAAWFLLGKVAAVQNDAPAATTDFQTALAQARPDETHIRTWANIFLARLFDAQNRRADAVARYQAALATADTPASKALAAAGIKAPYKPPGAH